MPEIATVLELDEEEVAGTDADAAEFVDEEALVPVEAPLPAPPESPPQPATRHCATIMMQQRGATFIVAR